MPWRVRAVMLLGGADGKPFQLDGRGWLKLNVRGRWLAYKLGLIPLRSIPYAGWALARVGG